MAVVSNSAQASFTVTGPATYQGSGYYWVQQGIPASTYTVTWNSVPGCSTPPSETKITNSQGSVAFAGNYQSIGSSTIPSPAGGPTLTPTPSPTRTPSSAIHTPTPQSYQPGQYHNQTPIPTVSLTTSLITPTPSAQPKGFFSRIFSSITSFVGRIFGRKSSAPPALTSENTNSQNSSGYSDNKLEGVWKVEQILMFDPTIDDYRQTQAGGNYTEYKGNQACINGVLGPNDTPQLCPRYETFTLSGNQIIMPSVTAYTIRFKISSDMLELTLDPRTSSTNLNSPQKQRIILSRLNKNVPDPSASSQPQASPIARTTATPIIVPIKAPTPAPTLSVKPTPAPSPVQSVAVQNLQGLWTTENSADRNMGINDMEFNGSKFCSVSNLCALGKADYWTYTVEGNAIIIKVPGVVGELGGGGTGYATLTYYFYFQGSKLVITFPGGSKYTFVKIPLYATPTPTSTY